MAPCYGVQANIHLELAQVLVGELIGLDFDQHKALQQPVIKYWVCEEVVAVELQALLPGYERKAVAQFQ